MTILPPIPVLRGSLVRLEPLSMDHAGDLALSAEEDRSAYGFTLVPRGWEVGEYIAAHAGRAQTGRLAPLAQIRRADGRAIGVTAYWDPRAWPGLDREDGGLCAVEIGWTWLAASAQRTGINVEAKFLLLRHAFETLGVARVDFKTDARNERSRRAIAGLGARFEGVLRQWGQSHAPGEDGLLRDSAMFSLTAAEWPAAKAALSRRLAARPPVPSEPSGAAGPAGRAPFALRAASGADIDALLALWEVAAENGGRPPDTRQALAALLGRDPGAVIVAERDSEVIGSVIAGWDGWRHHLYRLAVHPACRRAGVGSALLRAAEDRLASLGAARADAMVLDRNDLGQSLWRAAGYDRQDDWRRWVKGIERGV